MAPSSPDQQLPAGGWTRGRSKRWAPGMCCSAGSPHCARVEAQGAGGQEVRKVSPQKPPERGFRKEAAVTRVSCQQPSTQSAQHRRRWCLEALRERPLTVSSPLRPAPPPNSVHLSRCWASLSWSSEQLRWGELGKVKGHLPGCPGFSPTCWDPPPSPPTPRPGRRQGREAGEGRGSVPHWVS